VRTAPAVVVLQASVDVGREPDVVVAGHLHSLQDVDKSLFTRHDGVKKQTGCPGAASQTGRNPSEGVRERRSSCDRLARNQRQFLLRRAEERGPSPTGNSIG